MVSTQYWVHLVSYEWCLVRKKMHSCEAVIILYSTKKYFFKIYLCLQVLRSRHVFSNYLLTYIIIIKYLLHKLINFYYNILNASIRRSDNSLVWNVQIVFFSNQPLYNWSIQSSMNTKNSDQLRIESHTSQLLQIIH